MSSSPSRHALRRRRRVRGLIAATGIAATMSIAGVAVATAVPKVPVATTAPKITVLTKTHARATLKKRHTRATVKKAHKRVVAKTGATALLTAARSKVTVPKKKPKTVKPPSPPPPPPPPPPGPNTGSWWAPSAATPQAWQWELDHPLNLASATDLGTNSATFTGALAPAPTIYDIDGVDNAASTVAGLHAKGAHVICYISVGTYENWRPDAASFPAGLLGSGNGWPGEKWLNVSPAGPNYAKLQAIMTARLQMCSSKGFDAVEFDNIDGAENSTGFAISNTQNNTYVEWLAATAHSLGLAAFQKNYVDQSAVLAPFLDGAIDEQCFQYSECSSLAPYTAAGKPILEAEYSTSPASYCGPANAADINAVLFNSSLNGTVRVTCR